MIEKTCPLDSGDPSFLHKSSIPLMFVLNIGILPFGLDA